MRSIEYGAGKPEGAHPIANPRGNSLASAAAVIDRTGPDRFVHDPADGACATAAFGATAQAPVDLAGAARRAFGCDRPDLMVGNHVARTHDHGGTPYSDRPWAFRLFRFKRDRSATALSCHAGKHLRKRYDMKSF